jgi:hypothetical protein
MKGDFKDICLFIIHKISPCPSFPKRGITGNDISYRELGFKIKIELTMSVVNIINIKYSNYRACA